jgi:hypothetical protein
MENDIKKIKKNYQKQNLQIKNKKKKVNNITLLLFSFQNIIE